MGVEYTHYLIPTDNTYRPDLEALGLLVNALLHNRFVLRPGSEAFQSTITDVYADDDPAKATGCSVYVSKRQYRPFPCPCSPDDLAALAEELEFRIVWEIDSLKAAGLMYPLAHVPTTFDPKYQLQIRMAEDYVYLCSEVIGPFENTLCKCGQDLMYEEEDPKDLVPWRPPVFFDTRIYRVCPWCGALFRPQDRVARIRDGRTGEITEQRGGCCYRFAVVIDCGKAFDREVWPIRASENFLKTVEGSLGLEFYQVGDFS